LKFQDKELIRVDWRVWYRIPRDPAARMGSMAAL
jgi:hypothetical protein